MTYDHFIIAIAMIAMGRVPLGLHSDPFHEAMRLIEQQVKTDSLTHSDRLQHSLNCQPATCKPVVVSSSNVL